MAMAEPLRVACIGMGWWSDVLADAIKRSSKTQDRRLFFALRAKARGLRRQIWLPRFAEL